MTEVLAIRLNLEFLSGGGRERAARFRCRGKCKGARRGAWRGGVAGGGGGGGFAGGGGGRDWRGGGGACCSRKVLPGDVGWRWSAAGSGCPQGIDDGGSGADIHRPHHCQACQIWSVPMRVGLHISDFTWEGGAAELSSRMGAIAQRAEEAGVDRISVMDHLWQISMIGPPEHEMLEAYTALGWLAAKTSRVELLTMVTAVVYREPGLLAKAVSTLDVLSGGRAILGIGAAWNGDES